MRKAKLISLEEFKEKIEPLLSEMKFLTKRVNKDLDKVKFDWENWEYQKFDSATGYSPNYETLENGLSVVWMYAGGDWEYPVNFIIYHDGKELRGYIPVDGNQYDKEYKAAYGSQDDTKLYRERFGKLNYHDQPDLKDEPSEGEEDFERMKRDIIKRIEII